MRVSIIIANYNGESFLKKCLTSFINQVPRPEELMVVDNASTDQSVSLIKNEFPQIKLIETGRNNGYGSALNLGIRSSQGEIIILSNNDLFVCDDWLKHILSEFEQHEKCGLVASKVFYMDDPSRLHSAGMLFYGDLSAINRGLDETDHGRYECSEEVFGAYGAIMAFRRTVFETAGYFDEDYFLFREEDELMWRMHRKGWICRFAPNAKVYHKRSANTRMFSPLKLYYSERNRIWNVLKHMPLWYSLACLPFVVFRYWVNFTLSLKSNAGLKSSSIAKASKARLCLTLFHAWLAAFWQMPRECKKRILFGKNSVLSPGECLKLAKQYRASTSDLMK